jgi:hypothetical protein
VKTRENQLRTRSLDVVLRLRPGTPPPTREFVVWVEVLDFSVVSLVSDVRFEFPVAASLFDSIFRNVAGAVVVPDGPVSVGEAMDEVDRRTIVIPQPSGSVDEWEEQRAGALISCFEMRLEIEAPLALLRVPALGSISARVLEGPSRGRDTFL